MSIYDDMRGAASELMAEFKQGLIQYVPVVTVAGARPDRPASSEKGVPVTINATARPIKAQYVNGTHVVQKGKIVTIPNDGRVTPDMSGFIRIDGVDYKITELKAVPEAGEPITWFATVGN